MVNAFSFCLYGPPCYKYYTGLAENIVLIQTYFPDWRIYVYAGADVPEYFCELLKRYRGVVVIQTGLLGAENMIRRFYPIDEPDVDIMMVRDADSRIHWRDRWAIRQFVSSPFYLVHTIRDNIEHSAFLMGGLWGMRKSANINMHAAYAAFVWDPKRGHGVARDQNFLGDCIYPRLRPWMLLHYSHNRVYVGEVGVEIPFKFTNDVYCGRVENYEKPFFDPPEPQEVQTHHRLKLSR